ncbi:MAG TPA: SpoIIE family protein phosphatase [Bryobacteraceae bacterium]|nr:SpoIIE family protein phosphatase [Bryobacteraceae bacterium]
MKLDWKKRPKLYTFLALFLADIVAAFFGVTLIVLPLTLGLVAYGCFSLLRIVVHHSRLIWHLRNRLIVTYMFIGVVPIVLISALAYCGAWIVVGQMATYLVSSELTRRAAMLEGPARFLSEAPAAYRADVLREITPLLRERAPGFEALVTGDGDFRYPPNNDLGTLPAGWKNFTGTVYKDGAFYSMAIVNNGHRCSVFMAPLSRPVLEKLVPGIGTLGFLNVQDPQVELDKSTKNVPVNKRDVSFTRRLAGRVPPAYDPFDFEFPWVNPTELAYWDKPNSVRQAFLTVTTRPSAVLAVVFGDRVETSQISLQIFIVIAILLAIVELISIIIGVSMTRTITGAIHNIYEGTLRVGRGDFSHRIPVKGRDQIAAVGKSFNAMSEQLEQLIAVAKEKERLQSELAIASEVQNQLFPRTTPPTRTIQLTGSCQPARSVSGDYYDYLCLPNGNLALAIGDVAGKGISAALLMASIQSIMRTQLAQGPPMPSTMVAQLNRQLYSSTSPEKYATFFFGVYDENSRNLTYTNAGHLSPLLVRGTEVKPLEVTGTVVGLFPALTYQEQSISLYSGDLLVAYTDGITEPENAYGEEYGADRLAETVLLHRNAEPREIVAKVMESVKQWSGAPELPDDMTVVIARGVE